MEHLIAKDSDKEVFAVVEYDYKANEVDEVDLVRGQIICNIKPHLGGWWEGTVSSTGRRGMFPDNYVHVLDDIEHNSTVVMREKSSQFQRQCKALYSYTKVNEDELSLDVGDVIEFLAEVEEGWWRGKLNNKIGVFPSNFVVTMQCPQVIASDRQTPSLESKASIFATKTIKKKTNITKCQIKSEEQTEDTSAQVLRPNLPPRHLKEFCRVEFPYKPQNDDELELYIGDIISIVSKELPDQGWWKGEINGKIGVFPDNFVKLLSFNEKGEKDSRELEAEPFAASDINSSSNISCFEDPELKKLQVDVSRKSGIEIGNRAAHRNSLENKCFDAEIASFPHSLTKQKLNTETEKIIEKKPPAPTITKKPSVPVKKCLATENTLSELKPKVETASQNSNVSINSRCNKETLDSNVQVSISNKFINKYCEFDQVQRASILADIRTARVKPPKRRLPSTDRISINPVLYGDNSQDNSKTRDFGKIKVPWINELKASQVKPTPFVEPRTVTIKNKFEIGSGEKLVRSSEEPKVFVSCILSPLQLSALKPPEPFQKSKPLVKKAVSENDLHLQVLSEHIADKETSNRHQSKGTLGSASKEEAKLPTKLILPKEATSLALVEGKITFNFQERIENLETIVQQQQQSIEDLRKRLMIESSRVEMLFNKLEKYAECVTQV